MSVVSNTSLMSDYPTRSIRSVSLSSLGSVYTMPMFRLAQFEDVGQSSTDRSTSIATPRRNRS